MRGWKGGSIRAPEELPGCALLAVCCEAAEALLVCTHGGATGVVGGGGGIDCFRAASAVRSSGDSSSDSEPWEPSSSAWALDVLT
jgi:hypothetical protein